MSVVEMAINFCRSSATFGELLGHIDYEGWGRIPTNHPWRTNAMNNIRPVRLKECLLCTAPGIAGKRVILRPKQKSVSCMLDLVSKFCNPGEPVVYTCACTLLTAKACLQQPQHRRFVDYEKNLMCFVESLRLLVEVYAWQVSYLQSDIVQK